MSSWFTRRQPLAELPRLKPRSERSSATRVDLHEIAPELLPYLGQAAYLQLVVFQILSGSISALPGLADKEAVGDAAGLALARHQGLAAEIRRRGDDPAAVMAPFVAHIDAYVTATAGSDWVEQLLWVHVCAGLLDDFFIRLAAGLPGDFASRAARVLGHGAGHDALVPILQHEIAADSQLASRLAMWGRRLVGDTLLVARSALHHTDNVSSDEQQIEPVFTELIAAHTRRMDALGLTA